MNDWFAAERHAERAYRMYRSGRLEDAVRELLNALAINPHQVEWHADLGKAYARMGQHTPAVKWLEKAARLQAPSAHLLHTLAASYLEVGRYEDALKTLLQAQSLEPAEAEPYALAVEACRKLGDHEQAELMFYMAAQTGVDSAAAHLFMGLSLLDRAMPQRAVGCLQSACRLAQPDDPRPLIAMARAYRDTGNLESAHRAYNRLLKKMPGDTEALYGLAEVLWKMNQAAPALSTVRRLIRIAPREARAHFLEGSILLQTHRLAEAHAAMEVVLYEDASFPGVHRQLARVALHRGRLEEARRHLAAELSRKQTDAERGLADRWELAQLLMRAEAPRQAAGVLRELLVRDARRADVWQALALSCMMAGDLKAGCRAAKRSLRLDPLNLSLMQNLAVAHLMRGEPSRAAYWTSRAATIAPTHRRTRQLQARVWVAGFKRRLGWVIR